MLKPCPWLRIHGLEQVEENWNEMAKSGAPFLLANHNSKLDSLLITALLPLWLGPKMRSLIKKDLFSEPLFGAICTAVGHFPVFFKSTAEGTPIHFMSNSRTPSLTIAEIFHVYAIT